MKLIILDRDGVINFDSEAYIKNVSEWKPIPNSLEAIAKLSQAGYTVVIATNQSGIGRGLFSIEDLDAIHQVMQNQIRQKGGYIDTIFFCPHEPSDNCDCRKPNTGLFKLIAQYFQSDLQGVPAIGDSWRDIQAALKVGCCPALVRTGKGEQTFQQYATELRGIPVYQNLGEAVSHILLTTIL